MEPRSVDTVLTEWRAIERALEAAGDDEREDLQARAAALHTEYEMAVEARQARPEPVPQT